MGNENLPSLAKIMSDPMFEEYTDNEFGVLAEKLSRAGRHADVWALVRQVFAIGIERGERLRKTCRF